MKSFCKFKFSKLIFVPVFLWGWLSIAINLDTELYIDRNHHGYYSEERNSFHRLVVNDYLNSRPSFNLPEVIFITGPMAVGKSTLINIMAQKKLINLDEYVVIDMDEIRKHLPEYSSLVNSLENTAANSQLNSSGIEDKDKDKDKDKNSEAIGESTLIKKTQKESGYLQEIIFWEAIKSNKKIILTGSLSNADFYQKLFENLKNINSAMEVKTRLIYIDISWGQLLKNVFKRNQEIKRFTDLPSLRDKFMRARDGFNKIKNLFDTILTFISVDNDFRVISIEKPHLYKISFFSKGFDSFFKSENKSVNNTDEDIFVKAQKKAKQRDANSGYDIFLDVDWTLFYRIYKPELVNKAELIEWKTADGLIEYYRKSDNIELFLNRLAFRSDVRLHIFSGGEIDRISYLLDQIHLKNGKTAREIMVSINDKSKLFQRDITETAKFTDQYRKLPQLYFDLDLTRTIIVDDQISFADFGLKALNIFGIFNFESRPGASTNDEFIPENRAVKKREKNKLLMALKLIEEGIELDKAGYVVFSEWINNHFQKNGIKNFDFYSQKIKKLFNVKKYRKKVQCLELYQ